MTKEASADSRIVFDRVVIDQVGMRVYVDEQVVPLEPKAFAVLSLLARHPGRAFTRDEILDAVWGHRHVTAGVLNRVITLIRQALGEDSQGHRYLHTLHGVGYRLDAPVRFIADHTGLAANPTEAAKPDLLVVESTALGVANAQSAPAGVEVLDESVPTGVRRVRLRWLYVALLAASLGALAWWHHEENAAVAVTPVKPSPTLIVLPLRAVGGDKDESNFAEGLSEELITQLAHVEGLRLISSTTAQRAQLEDFDPAQLAQNLHVTHALEGSLRQEGEQLLIDLRLIEVPSGRTLWAQEYDRKLADVFAVQQEIARAVASALTLRILLVHSDMSKTDPQVLREYLELRHIFHSQIGAPVKKAERSLRALAARAPYFAPVHGLLALNLASNFEPHTEADVLSEATHALNLDPDSIYAHAALALLACHRMDWPTCMKELRLGLALNPTDSIMRLVYGMWCAHLGYRDEALLQFETAYAADPLNYWTNFQLGTELDVLGRHDEAKRYLDTLPDLEAAPNSYTATTRWRNAVWRHDFANARELVARMPEAGDLREAYSTVTEALLDPKRWPQAEAAIAVREATTGYHSWLRLQEQPMNVPLILTMFEQSLRDDGLEDRVVWASDDAALRRDPAFSDFLRRTHIINYWQSNGWPPQCRPEGDGAHCD
jgi:TolB-like protein/DNA-binding winged helix-turn-helix (wHTH) protein/Tfp pilus assembly protein PilF